MRSFIKSLTATMLAAVISATLANKTAAADISKLEFDPPVFYGNGLQSSLAANSSGLALEFNRGSSNDEIWYNVGKLGMTSMVWGANQFSGFRGHWPTVALTKDGYVLVVYNNQDRKNGCQLYYRVGKLNTRGDQNQSITWLTNSIHWDAGYKASIAINDKGLIVGVHETGHNSSGMYYRVGHLRNPAAGDYTIQWDSPSSGVYYNDGVNPHIAINNLNQIVEVHEVAGEHLLHYWRGTISGGTINFAQSRRYDNYAVEPAVALLDSGDVLEVHTLGGLISRTGKLNPSNAWEIQWAEPVKIDPETSIGYPALAVSGSYAFETHQRPASTTFFHEIYTSIAPVQGTGNVHYGLFVKDGPEGWSQGSNGQVAGTIGQNKKTDAFYINGFGFPAEFRIHVAHQGWRNWTPAVEGAHDSGVGKQLEAIQFRFSEGIPSGVHILARVHLQDVGWTSPVEIKDQTILGTTGLGRPLEAIQIAVGSDLNHLARLLAEG
jgi:hypothetical protein